MATVRHHSLGLLTGIVFVIAGVFAIIFPFIYRMDRPTLVGWLLIAVGAFLLISALFCALKGGRLGWLSVVIGALYLGVGIWLLSELRMGGLILRIALTALFGVLALLFIIEGWLKREDGCLCWMALLVAGVVSGVLAGLLWPAWAGATWVIGLFVGIQLIVYGLAKAAVSHASALKH
jgi:membrane protein HdeD